MAALNYNIWTNSKTGEYMVTRVGSDKVVKTFPANLSEAEVWEKFNSWRGAYL